MRLGWMAAQATRAVTDIHELALQFETRTAYAENMLMRFAQHLGRAEGELIIAGQGEVAEDLKQAFADHMEAQMLHLNTSMQIMRWAADAMRGADGVRNDAE